MAFGPETIQDFGAAASDIFAAQGDLAKQQGDYAEATEYNAAAGLALQNEQFTKQSTAIKEAQQQRELLTAQGGIQASTAGSGFQASGSSLDILRDSASQGAIAHAVLGQQGLITEAGYQEQATSYEMMQQAATAAGNAEGNASTFADITGSIKAIAGIATLA